MTDTTSLQRAAEIIRDVLEAAIAPMVIPTASTAVWTDAADACASLMDKAGLLRTTPGEGDAEEVIRKLEQRRLDLLSWIQDRIGTAWECSNCEYHTYHSHGFECDNCGAEMPIEHVLAFKLHVPFSNPAGEPTDRVAAPPPSPAPEERPRPQILQMLDPEPATPPADMVERAREAILRAALEKVLSKYTLESTDEKNIRGLLTKTDALVDALLSEAAGGGFGISRGLKRPGLPQQALDAPSGDQT